MTASGQAGRSMPVWDDEAWLPRLEPTFGMDRAVSVTVLRSLLRPGMAADARTTPPPEKPALIAVDGRSGSGKSTLAQFLALEPGWAVIHTDDIAWWHSSFDWADLMLDGVLKPLLTEGEVHFTPPAWRERGRTGSISIPSGTHTVVIEGVGASRAELKPHLDKTIWVHTAWADIIRRERARIRDGAVSLELQREWMSTELDFLDRQRPWERANLIVGGRYMLPTAVWLLSSPRRQRRTVPRPTPRIDLDLTHRPPRPGLETT